MVAVLILGTTTYGSKISYSIGGVTFQPSEFVKLFLYFCCECAICIYLFLQVAVLQSVAGIHVMILVLSRIWVVR